MTAVSLVSSSFFDGSSSGHGTHVAGTTMGANYGVAKVRESRLNTLEFRRLDLPFSAPPFCRRSDDQGGQRRSEDIARRPQEATLHCVKVLGDDGSGSYSAILNGLRWVVNHKTSNNIASAVVNMSLGGPRSSSLNDGVASTVAAGVTVVVSAGNDNSDACTVSSRM